MIVHFNRLFIGSCDNLLITDDESQMLVTINTNKGLFKYNHLPFDVTTVPSIFQHMMEHLLQDLKFVTLPPVTGKTTAEHLANLDEVLSRQECS